jgi:aldose 1-epimerase
MTTEQTGGGTGTRQLSATRYELRAAGGMRAVVTTHGATLVELHAPDRGGHLSDITLGFDDDAGYVANAGPYFGATVGRVANRIRGARFTLDGQEYVLVANEGANHLHGGGPRAFDKVAWSARPVDQPRGAAVELTYRSPHLEEGYPGNVDVRVVYRLSAGELRIDFEATTDRPTPLNLTNHAYFNLAGAGAPTVLDHLLEIPAHQYVVTDDALIPTGEVARVEGTPFDFNRPMALGTRIDELADGPKGGYDLDYPLDEPGGAMRFAARVTEPTTGRVMEVYTTQPSIQLYTGNRLDGVVGKGGKRYVRFSAFCLEPQRDPDAVHQPAFPSVIVRPGEMYRESIAFRFTTDRAG